MQPNNLPEQPQFSSDYLNQIAPAAPVKTLNPMVLWGLIAGVIILVIVVISAVGSMGGGANSSSLASIAARFDALKTVADDADRNIQSSELRTLNSALKLSLTDTNRELQVPLEAQDISLKDKKNESVIAVTTDFEALGSRLEDARLNGVFDRTYAREISYSLKTLRSDMTVLYNKTRSKSLKAALETSDANLKPLVEEFSSFNGS